MILYTCPATAMTGDEGGQVQDLKLVETQKSQESGDRYFSENLLIGMMNVHAQTVFENHDPCRRRKKSKGLVSEC